MTEGTSKDIVVGVDGSAGADAALAFALEDAARRGVNVRAVYSWHIPTLALAPAPFGTVIPAPTELQEAATEALTTILADVTAPEGVSVIPVVREGPAASVLLDEARDASLLVVGSRGHGGFTGLLLGSVSQQCASHSTCPVVVVHPEAKD